MHDLRPVVIVLLLVMVATVSASAQDTVPPRLITVSGNAEVRVPPDQVILTLGVETFDPDLATAKAANDDKVKAILHTAQEHGVEPKHVQTDYLGIEPEFESGYRHLDRLGYLVRRTVVITLSDVGAFEPLLAASLEAGANYVHGIDFRTTELRRHRDRARSLAIDAARDKAEALAEQLDQSVGKPHSISEGYSGWWSGYGRWWGSSWRGGMSQNVVQAQGSGQQPSTATAPGQLAVTAAVTVSFELE